MDDGKPTVCDGESEPEKIRYGRTHSNKGILLVPKPSTDPNDPLVSLPILCIRFK